MLRYAWFFLSFLSGTTAVAADWPQWQGPDRNAVSKETGLLKEWPKDGPPLAWKVNGIGEGMGGVAVSKGRIYTTGDRDGSAWLFALNESDGKQVWKAKIGRAGKYGNVFRPSGPRATPTVDGDKLYILSQHGDLVCFTTDGKEDWRTEYVKDLGGILPVWGFSESPLVDGDKLVCTPGAEDGTLMALDKKTGKPIWKCPVPEGPTGDRGFLGKSGAAYASVIAVDFEGVRHYVQLASTTLIGVAASDGKLLWRYDRPSNTHRINCSTPVYHDGMVFAASSYDAGGGAVKLSKDNKDTIAAKEVYFSTRLKNHHGGMVLVDGYLYGSFDPGILTCIEFKTGKVMWEDRRPGKGSVIYADGRLYCRNEGREGTVYLVEANPKEYVERGRFNQPERTREQAWAHPVVANGKLYIRDQHLLLCYDVKANGNSGDSSGEFSVWPGVAPGSEKWTRKELITGSGDRRMVRNVVRPTLTPFLPKPGTANGTAVVVAPGGAFRFLSWDNEGTKVAEWLSERGVTAFVLKYRLVDTGSTDAELQKSMQELGRSFREPGGPFEHPETKQVAEMAAEDGRQAIRVLRQQAEKWGINPRRIGIMGFSAGAVVATRVGVRHDADSRPDFVGAIYGAPMRDYAVPADAPALFVLFAKDDGIGVQATELHKKWKDAGKPAELVTFERGGHGFGMSKRGQPTDGWIERFWGWLTAQGYAR